MNIINLTPHTIVVEKPNGERVSFPPSGTVARVAVRNVPDSPLDGIPVSRPEYGPVEGLPNPEEGTTYIVSMLVGGRVSGRSDIVGPDSGPTAIRFTEGPQKGQIDAVRGFNRY